MIILWLIFWVVPVIVLFNKGQTGWAVTGLILGWIMPLIWMIAAIAVPNKNKIAAERMRLGLEERRHMETLSAITRESIPAASAQSSESVGDRLATLDRLLDQGRITQSEYTERRSQILGEI